MNRHAVAIAVTLSLVAVPSIGSAQDPGGECSSGFCGTPRQVGGGCGCGCGCAVLIANTDMGETYSTSDDFDNDGFEDDFDNCPFIQNRDQLDGDGDGSGDACDNAPALPNPDQSDIDGDGIGDVADPDIDGDTIPNEADNCVRVYNITQRKTMPESSLGDACNPDDDLDGIPDREDRCPKIPGDTSIDGRPCDEDEDLDGVDDQRDNCPGISNVLQDDVDGDLLGDACDSDIDGDRIPNNLDNAPKTFNPDQIDRDRDGIGDAAESFPADFCYVYDRTRPEACLNPLDTFKVGALAVIPRPELVAGTDALLVLFANRVDAAIEYTWTVDRAPSSSRATVRAARGKTVASKPESEGFEYAYAFDGNNVAPVFVPDEPGEYELKLVAKLMFEDDVFPGGPTVATYALRLTATGEGQSGAGGCSAAARSGLGVSILMVLAGIVLLRRRRS